MISYLQGKIILKKEKFVILDVNGVGYKIFLSQKTLLGLQKNSQDFKFFCYLNVRENALDLYGFLDFEELELFGILNDISGVGPKIALEISSLGPLEKLKKTIEEKNEKVFEGIPGIGRKRAQAIILELSGKIKETTKEKNLKTDEAEEALINLGFPRQKAREVLSEIPGEVKDTKQRIKEALKILGK